MAFHRAARIGVIILFVLLLTGFVAFRSGAFDRQIQRWMSPRSGSMETLIDSPPSSNYRSSLSPKQRDSLLEQLGRELVAAKFKDTALYEQYQLEAGAKAVRNYKIPDSIARMYEGKPYTTDTATLFLVPFPGSKSAFLITPDYISKFTEEEKQKLHLIRMERKLGQERWEQYKKEREMEEAEEAAAAKDSLRTISKPTILPSSKSITPLIDPATIKIDSPPLQKNDPVKKDTGPVAVPFLGGTKSKAVFTKEDIQKIQLKAKEDSLRKNDSMKQKIKPSQQMRSTKSGMMFIPDDLKIPGLSWNNESKKQ